MSEVAPSSRDLTFDVLKGIGIAEVLTHHTLGFSMRKYAESGTAEWWAMWTLNRVLHFAIPMFLLCSALLLARSLAKSERPDYGRYARRRLVRTVAPYLLWSLAFLFWRGFVLDVGSDVHPYTWRLPWGGTLTGPNVLLDPAELKHYLIWGKAFFHLYFLSILIQLTLLLPFVVILLRRVRLRFGAVVLTSGVLQIGAFLFQASVLRSPHPASIFIWYVPSILLGAWIGIHWAEWRETWTQSKGWIAVAAIVGLGPYFALALMNQRGQPISNLVLNSSLALFATATALFLLGCAGSWRPTKLVRAAAWLGSLSLPLFILHPILLHLLAGPRITKVLNAIPGSPMVTLVLLTALTLAATHVLIWLRLDGILFGRSYRREPRAETPTETAAAVA